MSENLIVYYSRTGTARQVAEAVAAHTGWGLAEVREKTPRAGLAGDLRCVLDMLLHRKPPYRYEGPLLAGCGHVVVVAPVWLGRLAAPMRAFLQDNMPLPGSVSAICVMASRGAFRAEDDIARLTGKTPQPALVLQQRDVQSGAASEPLAAFAAALCKPATTPETVLRPVWISPKEV
uniref:flavodoxin family protein n=1 Tax=Cupriavidus yeoncheonensis TaxID=1462994 RepID=UPI003F4974D7